MSERRARRAWPALLTLFVALASMLNCTGAHPAGTGPPRSAATATRLATAATTPSIAAIAPAPAASVAAGAAPRTFDPPGGSAAWAQRASGCHGVPLPPGSPAPTASDTGVSPSEVRLGVVWPLSGYYGAYGTIVRALQACFAAVNAEGGIYGRQITWLAEDDDLLPADSLALATKLVEGQRVFAMEGALTTPSNEAIVDYLNDHRIPDLFVTAGTSRFSSDPTHYPWVMGWTVPYPVEAAVYATYIQQNLPGKKVGILYDAGDFGADYLAGVTRVLGAQGTASNPIVGEEPVLRRDPPEIEPQMTRLKDAGAEVLLFLTTPGPATSAVKWAAEHGWKPESILAFSAVQNYDLASLSSSAGGSQNLEGFITSATVRHFDDPDPALAELRDFFQLKASQIDLAGNQREFAVGGYILAQAWIETLKRAGVNPTRTSLLQAAESFRGFVIPQFLPGIALTTSATNHAPIRCMQLLRYHDGDLTPFGTSICTEP